MPKGHSTYGSYILFISNLKKSACASNVRFISSFVFRQFWRRSYENQLSLSGKDSAADFFVFGNFDQNTKNENCNELDNNENYFKKAIGKANDFAYLLPIFLLMIPKEILWIKAKTTEWKPPKNCTILRVPNFNGTFQSRFRHIPVQLFFGQKSRSDLWKKSSNCWWSA